MTFTADVLADLDTMLSDWGDSVSIAGISYPCLYDQEYVEFSNMEGYKPVITGKASVLGSVTQGTNVTVVSAINAIAGASYTVMVNQPMGDGTCKLILEAA